MSYPRIIEKVYREPWLVKPSVHHSIQSTLLAALNGERIHADYEDDNETDEQPYYNEGGVSIVPISGIIGKHLSLMETSCGGVDVDTVSLALDAAVLDESTSRILLYFDTGGGTVTGVPELAERISQASEVKEVISYTDSLCASAGYWLASQANAFYCSTSAEVGSIGVYMALLDESEKLAKEGVKVEAFSAGKYKLAGSSFKPLTDEERDMFQQDVDYWYDLFTSSVLNKRELKAETMQGQCFVGEKAVEHNLVDGIVDSFDELLAMTAKA
jgi:signal peptide peptidase SppA